METLIKNLTPEAIAKLSAAISSTLTPDMGDDFAILNALSNEVYDLGVEKEGMNFVALYFDAVEASAS